MTNAVSLRRRRELSQIFDDSFKAYGGPIYSPLLFILAIPTIALNLAVFGIEQSLPSLGATLITAPLGFIGGALLGTGAVYAIDQIDRGNEVKPGRAIVVALNRANHLLFAAMKVAVICGLLSITIIGIPWAIARLVSWSFTSQAIMVDGQIGDTALEFSHDLVAGRGWPTFGLMFVTYMFTGFITGIVQALGYLFLDGVVAGVINSILPIVTFPFITMSHLLIYYDLKMRKALG